MNELMFANNKCGSLAKESCPVRKRKEDSEKIQRAACGLHRACAPVTGCVAGAGGAERLETFDVRRHPVSVDHLVSLL